jgi:hypothetical protein
VTANAVLSRALRARTQRSRALCAPFALLGLLGCGGAPAREPAPPAPATAAEPAPERSSGMEVSGLLGTIPDRHVHGALEPKLGAFQRCFARGAQQVEFIGGAIEFYFRVRADGTVEWVFARASSLGHRATEQCLVEVAASARFPKPQGGDAAEVAWSFEIDPPEDVRPPVPWQASNLEPALGEQVGSLASCGLAPGGLLVTAYVAPGGKLLAAGASATSREAAERIDCALTAIAAWSLPDPGSYAAKVSFAAP